jgi:NTP pyrophosphatase (non-canonical NTP hydrolase)
MTRQEHLLIRLAEECSEVIKEISKSLIFGLDNHYPMGAETNSQKIMDELNDLIAVADMLKEDGAIGPFINQEKILAKKKKVEQYLVYSKKLNKLTE